VNCFIWELDRSIKRKSRESQKNADTIGQIDALRLTLHTYFASTLAFVAQSIQRNVRGPFRHSPTSVP